MHLHTSEQGVAELGFYDCTCNWGTHICGLYESDDERDEILFNFLGTGDFLGDLQLYCPVERSLDEFKAAFIKRIPDATDHIDDSGRFQFFDAKGLYYPDGLFSPTAMDIGLSAFYSESQAHGPRNIRATAEMVWALEAVPGIEYLMAYEARLNYFIPGKPWISICLYNVNKFDGGTVMNVLKTHPYTISGGGVMENPYYQLPQDWLAANAPEFL